MCVIVHQPLGAHLDKKRAKRLWNANSDGGGFAYIDDSGEIRVAKAMEFDSFWSAFERARSDFPKRDFLVHMRIATHGKVAPKNTHPFRVDQHTVMAHNGILHKVVGKASKKKSDTRVFIDEVLPELPDGWLDSPILRNMVEEWIGRGNKLMFLTKDPNLSQNVYILNRSVGEEADGMWFSNRRGVMEPKPPKRYSYDYYTAEPGHAFGFAAGRGSEDFHGLTPGVRNTRSTRLRQVWDGGKVTEMTEDAYFLWLKERAKPTAMKSAIESAAVFAAEGIEGCNSTPQDDALEEKRAERELFKDVFFNPVTNLWECVGCDEQVDEATGECGCWDMLCLDCVNLAAWCDCSNGYSTNLVHLANASDEAVLEAYRKGVLLDSKQD